VRKCIITKKEKAAEEAISARGFSVCFLNRSFPNYCLGSGEDKSLNKDEIYKRTPHI